MHFDKLELASHVPVHLSYELGEACRYGTVPEIDGLV